MIRRLFLRGHVHNRPWHNITSDYSWPQGVAKEEADRLIMSFGRAYRIQRAELLWL
jgi:hypothetical protein